MENEGRWNLNRRTFLKGTAVVAASAFAGSVWTWDRRGGLVGKADASNASVSGDGTRFVKSVCPYCSMGCGILARVENGVYVDQEPWFDHPINGGTLCGRGAAAIQAVTSEKRLRYPMKKAGRSWQRIDWETAMGEITSKLLDIRGQYGPDAVMWLGSAKISTEEAYMFRKLVAFWGTNNVDSQSRFCHSPILVGLSSTLGLGVQTNPINDVESTKCAFFIGSNASETCPMVMRHIIAAKENNAAKIIVADPRFTKTATKADEYVQFRSGTDIALINGLINLILQNGWYDSEFIEKRTHGLDQVSKAVAAYSPVEVENITGVTGSQIERVARMLYENNPATVIYSSGLTSHSTGTQNVRAIAILQLLLGNIGKSGGGLISLGGQDNTQGAADMGLLSDTLPGYYGLDEGAWRHWADMWGVDYDWLVSRFSSKPLMQKPGLTAARWYEAVLEPNQIDQNTPIKAVVIWGHGVNSVSDLYRLRQALDQLELIVVVDPFPTAAAVISDRSNGLYLLPAATQQEKTGSVTNISRQTQWRYQIVEPLYESRPDYEILLDLADRLVPGSEYSSGWANMPDDVMEEINRGAISLGLKGRTIDRIKYQMNNAADFDSDTLQARGGTLKGEYFGLPWPCWNTQHPGTPILYDLSKPVAKGGHAIPTKWGSKAVDGKSLLSASSNPWSQSAEGYLEESGWDTDISGDTLNNALGAGMLPSGNGKARLRAWDLLDEVPIHREPINTIRPDLIELYPSYSDSGKNLFRVPTAFKGAQLADTANKYPYILILGKVAAQHGSGGMSNNSWWLSELQPEPYVEINSRTATNLGIRKGEIVWIDSPNGSIRVKVKITEGVPKDAVFIPFHWSSVLSGEDLRKRYPEDLVPYGKGDSANVVANYGYDKVTQTPESKTGLCMIRR